MRTLLIVVPFALLAACGSGGGNKAGNASNASNAAVPAANASAPAANASASADPRRANEIQECVADVRTELPEGADVNGFCGCAVDRMQGAGSSEREAMEACATQLGIQPRGR